MLRILKTKNSMHKTYQLLKTIYPDNTIEEFVYDKAGNRERGILTTNSTNYTNDYSHNANNEMLSVIPADAGISTYFEYDSNGSMIEKVEGENTWEYIYNIENRLSSVRKTFNSELSTINYYYDPFGRRLWKEVFGTKTYFFYSKEGITAEINNSGEIVKTYGYTPNSIWTADPLWTREGWQYYFYQNDHLATPQRIISSNGSIVWSADYESFGKSAVKVNTIENNLRFPGQYYDGESMVMYNRYRYYNQETGRYLKVDPINFDGLDLNIFRYVYNNPMNYYDSLGLFGEGYNAGGSFAGHSDFENDPNGCNFDWNKEDRGWSAPYYPWSIWRHFRAYDSDLMNDLFKDIEKCNKRKFERHMHQMQDYYSHYAQGYWGTFNKKGIIGHAKDFTEPDEADRNTRNPQYLQWEKAEEETKFWVDLWKKACKCSKNP